MGFNIWKIFQPKNGPVSRKEITCHEIFEAGQELMIREMCFAVCVNMIANAIGRCEVRVFRDKKEVKDREYYMWNIEPNTNQNGTAFWHKAVGKLLEENETLIIGTRRRDGYDAVVVADDWTDGDQFPSRQNEYRDVVVGDMTYDKTFRENDVLHLKLNHINVKPIIDGMYQSYCRMLNAAMRYYEWGHGQHWKVHVEELKTGYEGWTEDFQKMITAQVKPFLESNGAILPEFDGYNYQNMGGEALGEAGDVRSLVEDVFTFTARCCLIPAVLINGQVSGAENAVERFLTDCIDPICDQITEEITRKRYGFDGWQRGSYVQMDSSAIRHFDIFANAPNVEKLVGSGAFTVNDVLRAAGMPTINEPWANEHFLTKNIATIQDAARSLEAQKGGGT